MTGLSLSSQLARRLFIHKQRHSGVTPEPTAANMLEIARAIRCLQLDPISAVARSHRLVMFSRVGPYDLTQFDQLLWRDRALFEYWAHCASIVLTEDYPLHHARMRAYNAPAGPNHLSWGTRMRQWVRDNAQLKRFILKEIKKYGPRLSRDLEEAGVDPREWVSTGWTSGRNISQMLDYLWMSGQIMVAERRGGQKVWDLTERVLPQSTPREKLTEHEVTRRAIEHSLRALGVGTEKHIKYHFVRGRYPHFKETLADLIKEKGIREVAIEAWPGQWYMHTDDEPLLDDSLFTLHAASEATRTTLLSPFDNLIADRARALRMFDFDFRIEIYVPPAKRKYGYYVLPILHGERLIGRLDPVMDRASGCLTVNAVFAEPGAPRDAGPAIATAVQSLAQFLSAREIRYNPRRIPANWKKALTR
ncbi:MAG: winged helix-turn-helix domain-containing protein [Anaerolineales bacterium]